MTQNEQQNAVTKATLEAPRQIEYIYNNQTDKENTAIKRRTLRHIKLCGIVFLTAMLLAVVQANAAEAQDKQTVTGKDPFICGVHVRILTNGYHKAYKTGGDTAGFARRIKNVFELCWADTRNVDMMMLLYRLKNRLPAHRV